MEYIGKAYALEVSRCCYWILLQFILCILICVVGEERPGHCSHESLLEKLDKVAKEINEQ